MNMRNAKQSGFTLVEIAIVLVIIGLLLGGILKGQELINSARVRNLADTNAGIQAAYYGFIDRYRQIPGDWTASNATNGIGVTITGDGNQNGRLDAGTSATDFWTESSALWEQLSKAGFISGTYNGGVSAVAAYQAQDVAPRNAFNGYMQVYRTDSYANGADNATLGSVRLGLVMGRNIPVNIAREIDVKLDDGIPVTGTTRATHPTMGSVTVALPVIGLITGAAGSATGCVDASNSPRIWNIAANQQDCNMMFLY